MQLSTILLLGSAAVVSAVDLTRYNGVDCNNYFLVWNNLEPDVCYSWRIFDLKFGSVQWSAIPQGQKLNVAMYGDLSCSDLISPPGASIEDTTCFSGSGRLIKSASYDLGNKRRARKTTRSAAGATEGQEACEEKPPNKVGLADGTVYNVDGLSEDLLDTLILFAYNGSTAADIPEAYDGLLTVRE